MSENCIHARFNSCRHECEVCLKSQLSQVQGELKQLQKAWQAQDDRHLKYEEELKAENEKLVKVIEERGYAFQEAINKTLIERDKFKAALQRINLECDDGCSMAECKPYCACQIAKQALQPREGE